MKFPVDFKGTKNKMYHTVKLGVTKCQFGLIPHKEAITNGLFLMIWCEKYYPKRLSQPIIKSRIQSLLITQRPELACLVFVEA